MIPKNGDSPKVSIVIPTFNRKDYVGKAIETSLNQTVPCEVVVCDHGSTDGTPEFMKQYTDKLIYVRRDVDFGPHFCWLDGVLHAKGEFIHIQYDDDWIDKRFVEKCLSLMDDDVGMAFVNAVLMNLKTGEKKEYTRFKKKGFETGVYENKIFERLYVKKGFMISPGASLYRKRDVVDALYQGNLPLQIGDEYHGVGPDSFMTLITFLRYKKFGYVNEDLAFFGLHDGSITIDAHGDDAKRKKIKAAYEEVITYYKILKFARKCRCLFKG